MDVRDDSAERRPRRRTKRPDLVRGEMVRMSHTSAYACAIGCAIWCAVGVMQVSVWCYAMVRWATGNEEFPTPALLLMGITFAVAPAGVGYRLVTKARRGRRIVIGRECVQVLEGTGDETCARVSIPYSNLEAVRCTRVDFGYRLDFELIDVHDPDTYLPGIDIEVNYRDHGYHVAVTESYRESMAWLRAEIRAARRRWRKKNPESEE